MKKSAMLPLIILASFAAIAQPSRGICKEPSTALPHQPALGPLRVHPTNKRYFTDGTKLPDGSFKAV
jgi:hypothetical protein